MKGIILAGGAGSRLYPLTKVMSKQLLPIYEKPMIYYSLSNLMLCGIREVLIITTAHDQEHFIKLLGDGSDLGIKLEYKIQEEPRGLPDAFIIGERFIGNDNVALVLGDNLFYGDFHNFRKAVSLVEGGKVSAKIFAYKVLDPERYGVVEFDKDSLAVKSIEEKPLKPRSSYAIPGFYIFDKTCTIKAKKIKPSLRGETEIIELIRQYLDEGSLGVEQIGRGIAWLDTGTPQSLLEASSFIGAIEQRQGLKVACLEEIAYRMGFLNREQFVHLIKNIPESSYRKYLEAVLDN